MGQIFISYSRRDIVYANTLISALKREGFDPWVDTEGLRAGTYWRERLEKQIKTCDAYLLIISRNSKGSKWVHEELEEAQNENKPIFPLRLDKTMPFFGVRSIQYEDVRGGKLPSEEFYRRLAAVAERKKRTRRNANRTDKAKKQMMEGASQLLSYYGEEVSSKGKDFIAKASKRLTETLADTKESVKNSAAMKKISARVKGTSAPDRKETTQEKKPQKKK